MSKSMRTHRPVQAWKFALRFDEILLKDITKFPTGTGADCLHSGREACQIVRGDRGGFPASADLPFSMRVAGHLAGETCLLLSDFGYLRWCPVHFRLGSFVIQIFPVSSPIGTAILSRATEISSAFTATFSKLRLEVWE